MSERPIEFPFQHPAAGEAGHIFHALAVYTEAAYRALPQRDRYLYDVVWFENEVMNGGVDQYLYNSGGDHAAECLEALAAIGAMESYDLLSQACRLFPDAMPSANWTVRREQRQKIAGENYVDDLISGEIEPDLYQRLMSYYRKADPEGR